MKKRQTKTDSPKPNTDKSYTGRQKKVVKANSEDSAGAEKTKRPRIKKTKEDNEIGFRQNNRKRNTSSSEDSSSEKKKITKDYKSFSGSPFKKRDSKTSGNFKRKEKFDNSYPTERKKEESSDFRPKRNFKDSSNFTKDSSFRKTDSKRPYKKPFVKDSDEIAKKGNDSAGIKDNNEERINSGSRKFSRSASRVKENPKRPFKKEFEKRAPDAEDRSELKSPRKTGRFEKTSSFRKDLKKEPPIYNNLKPKNAPKTESDSLAEIRLNRYIANAGICSRREADELITNGSIRVNDIVVTEMGFKVKPSDVVKYEKRILKREKLVYVLLNKPKDFITTTDDPEERRTVMDLIKNACDERIYPVGRLDRNTTGLLLVTNDGDLADKLSHPSNEIKKIYQVLLDKPLTDEDFEKVKEGVLLDDGPANVDDLSIVTPNATVIGIELHLGRNRIVRRIFEHLGYQVLGLDRVVYAGLTKKDLPRGHWRYLTEKEVIQLKHFS